MKKLITRDIVHKITLFNAAHWQPQLGFIHLQVLVNTTVAVKKISSFQNLFRNDATQNKNCYER